MVGDTLFVSLVASPGAWYPEADDGCALQVLTFAEEGKQPSVPGPLIRVRAGTAIHASVRNATGKTLWVRGFHDRPSVPGAALELPPDSARDFRFSATTPGTYAYGATLEPFPDGGATVRPTRDDSQLLGAFVVDSASAPEHPADRVLVLTRWTLRGPNDPPAAAARFFTNAVNGKVWPHNEQLTYSAGDSVHWRVVNASNAGHPMHLHGFYFNVEAKGTFTAETVLAKRRTVVTEQVSVGQTMRISWRADRPGNWLFHCHLVVHMSIAQRLDQMSDSASALMLGETASGMRNPQAGPNATDVMPGSHVNHAMDGMAGLIVGVRVWPRAGMVSRARLAPPTRTLRLFANERAVVFPGGATGYGFVIQHGSREPAPDSVQIPGSAIVLRRGEPVQITVVNRLSIPLSVHWHGLELDSYFDGVGDWSGGQEKLAPAITPGDSFVVRLTPPRTGTFMYHIHGEPGRELASGLYGPLIVTDGETSSDTLSSRMLLISDAGPAVPPGAFVNGSRSPRIEMTAGRAYRLRIMSIPANATREVSVLQGSDTASWRLLARDGAEITGTREPPTQALQLFGPGMTADYGITPRPGETLTLRVVSRGPAGRVRETLSIPIVVTSPR
jgi:FtsP/CotA-like multicopper oxidase with cupredoxin domain